MLNHTKVFSLTVAALLILTLAPGAPFGHASLGYARDRQGEPTTAARTRIGRIETDTFDSATNDPPNPAHPPFSTAGGAGRRRVTPI